MKRDGKCIMHNESTSRVLLRYDIVINVSFHNLSYEICECSFYHRGRKLPFEVRSQRQRLNHKGSGYDSELLFTDALASAAFSLLIFQEFFTLKVCTREAWI